MCRIKCSNAQSMLICVLFMKAIHTQLAITFINARMARMACAFNAKRKWGSSKTWVGCALYLKCVLCQIWCVVALNCFYSLLHGWVKNSNHNSNCLRYYFKIELYDLCVSSGICDGKILIKITFERRTLCKRYVRMESARMKMSARRQSNWHRP